MNADTTPRPGVVSASIEADLSLPPSLDGLLKLSQAFDRAGYAKLARYLRGCGDALCGRPAPSPTPAPAQAAQPVTPFGSTAPSVLYANFYADVRSDGSLLGVTLTGSLDDVQAVRLGGRYMLVPVGETEAPRTATECPGNHGLYDCGNDCRVARLFAHYLALADAAAIPAGDQWKG